MRSVEEWLLGFASAATLLEGTSSELIAKVCCLRDSVDNSISNSLYKTSGYLG